LSLVYYIRGWINKLEITQVKGISKASLFQFVLALAFFTWYLITGSEVMGILSLFLVTWAQIDQLQFKLKDK